MAGQTRGPVFFIGQKGLELPNWPILLPKIPKIPEFSVEIPKIPRQLDRHTANWLWWYCPRQGPCPMYSSTRRENFPG